MTIDVLSEWFLEEINKYIAALNELRRRIFNALASISVSLSRLILLLLKRTIGIIKSWIKESRVDEWLKAIFHGSYLGVSEGLYIFLYILHFFRAFLTLINYFSDQDNKNLVEVTKFLYACFKVFISLVMLTFLIVLIAHGFAPLGLLAYEHIKTFFRIYTLSKFAINFITLGFSFYQCKTGDHSSDHAWLKAQYQNNLKKHTQILLVGGLITLALTIVSLGLVTGPLFWVMVGVASILLLIDMAKAIYFHVKGCDVPEPEVAILPQQNSLIDFSVNDYYYRKCRIARLKTDDPEANRIYLLKEIVVKIIQLQTKLENTTTSRLGFFSEKQKIQEKIDGLTQEAQELLKDKQAKLETVIELLISLQIEIQEVKDSGNKPSVSITVLQEYIQGLKNQLQLMKNGDVCSVKLELNNKNNNLWNLIFTEKTSKKSISQSFRQSFFRKKGDCEDISDACQKLKELEQKDLNTETRLQPFIHGNRCVLAAG